MSEQVFVSYSHKDGDFVGRSSTALTAVGYSVWFDQRALEVGDRWREEIVAGIKACEGFVLVLSESSVESPEVSTELGLAEGHGKPIFPARIGEVEISDRLAYELAGIQFKTFQAGEDERAMERLVQGLRTAEIVPAPGGAGRRGSACLGRERELGFLPSAVESAASGSAEVRSLAGEAGSGKTVIANTLLRRAVRVRKDLLAAAASANPPTGLGDAYRPFREVFDLLLGDVAGYSALVGVDTRNATRLRDRIATSTELLLEHAPDLVGTVAPGIDRLRVLETQAGSDPALIGPLTERVGAQRCSGSDLDEDRIHSQGVALLRALSREAPMLVVLEDLQWADAASIELLSRLVARLDPARVLLLGTYRPSEIALGRDGERHPLQPVLNEIKRRLGNVHIVLDNDDRKRAREFVDTVVDSAPNRLRDGFREAPLERTGGNALFTTELLDNLRERGALALDAEGRWVSSGGLAWDELPAPAEAVLEERVARLDEDELAILEVASLEGPRFTAELVAGIQRVDEQALVRTLPLDLERRQGLVQAKGVERRGEHWISRYRFVQTHLQSYVYGTLDPRERMLFHDRLARALSAMFEVATDEIAPQLVWHFDQAGDAERAVHHSLIAARQALAVSGYGEAARHLDRARELLVGLAAGRARSETELGLHGLRCTVLKVRCGWACEEVEAAYGRDRAFGSELGPNPHLTPVPFGQWALHLVRLELARAREVAGECRKLAETLEDADGLIQAEVAVGNTLYWMGGLNEARECMLGALRRFRGTDAEVHVLRHGQDSRIFALMFLSLIASIAGELDEAADLERRMLELAREIDHPFSFAIALQGAAWSQFHFDKPEVAEVYAQQLVEVTRTHRFPYYLGVGMMIHGWAVGMQRDARGGLAELERGFAEHLAAVGGRLFHPVYCLLRAQVLYWHGEVDAGLATVDDALSVAWECDELAYASELLRMQGLLRARAGDGDFERALESLEGAEATPRSQGTPTFEVRAERDLASLRAGARPPGGNLAHGSG